MGALVFSRVTFAGLVLNFVAIPLMTVAQVAGMLVVALSPVWSFAADLCGARWRISARRGWWGARVSWTSSHGSSYRLPPPHWVAMAGYYAGWAAWLAAGPVGAVSRRAARWRRRLRLAGAVGVVACGAWISSSR